MSNLSIYRASAGSGKTYRLTLEYLKLLFQNTNNYRNILAVTFTNKATEEMKSRIVKEINSLAKGNGSPYITELQEVYDLSEQEIQKKAQEILNKLLHDYSRFSVGTIDSFFQRVLRSFTREIGLHVGFNIELDTTKVLDEVIDKLLLDIDGKNSLSKWLINFAENKVEEGKSWNFKQDIKQLGFEVFKEDFKSMDSALIKKFEDKDFLKNYLEQLQKIKTGFEEHLKAIGDKALLIIENHSLEVDDFSNGKSGVAGHFMKLVEKKSFEPGKRALAAYNNEDKWFSKKTVHKNEIISAFHAGLNDCLGEAINYYEQNYFSYNSVDKILSFIYTLGILTDIAAKIKEHTNEKNIFLLADAANLLQDIIGENDSPFIYEKIGFVYRYFMIDEFQDTSNLQWNNFRPLINNSLSEGNKSLVVGDVKQSIYRWRNSDWKLLSEQIEKDFAGYGVNNETLEFNWRSKQNVVEFNNTFFQHAATILQQEINSSIPDDEKAQEALADIKTRVTHAYEALYQYLPKEKENRGYINAEFLAQDEEISWRESVKLQLPKMVEGLQDKGYKLKDIVFLVRGKSDGKEIADLFLDYKNSEESSDKYRYDVISNEALYLMNAPSVRLIIHLMKYFDTPADVINKAFVVHEYMLYLKDAESNTVLSELFNFNDSPEESFEKYLPEQFIAQIETLKKLPFYELTERLISIFELNDIEHDMPYIQAFQDVVMEFSKNEAPDIHSFIKWWNEEGDKKTLSTSEQQDAMQIMTIHKSKGLEFKVVVIPFCDWLLDHNPLHTNILWCKPEIEPFNELELLPVKYSSKLAETIFFKDYFDEKLKVYVDNLNLLYVAYTRAEDMLYTFSPKPKKEGELKSVADLAYFIFKNSQNFALPTNDTSQKFIKLSEHWDDEKSVFENGKPEAVKVEKTEANSNDLSLKAYSSPLIGEQLKLKQKSKDFFTMADTPVTQKVNYGTLMHELFENIIYVDDTERVIRQFVFDGKVTEAEGEELKQQVSQLMQNEQVKIWFSKEWKVKNETPILLKGRYAKRPDRILIKDDKAIVIDYKFGEKETLMYNKQVNEYKTYLLQMGFKSVEGYVWYVNLEKIQKV